MGSEVTVIYLISISLILYGGLVSFGKRFGLLYKWDESKFSEPEAAAKTLGMSFIASGLFSLLAGVLRHCQFVSSGSFLFFAYLPILFIVFIAVKNINKNYVRSDL